MCLCEYRFTLSLLPHVACNWCLASVDCGGGVESAGGVLNDNHSHIESGYEEVSLSKHLESVVSEKETEINELTGENRLLQEDLEVQ